MRDVRKLCGAVAAVVLLSVLAPISALGASAPQSTELWGGPGAKGTGQFGSRFDTVIYIGGSVPASATIDFYLKGSLAASTSVAVPARGTVAVTAPSILENAGAFFYRIRSDAAVTAWSETFNSDSNGVFGIGIDAFLVTDFLNPGDEASGPGADASSSVAPGRSRTNVGVLCNPGSTQACHVEIAAFKDGTLLGSGSIDAAPGATAQASLGNLIPGAAEQNLLSLRFRLFAGSGAPYAIKNHNDTSDAARIPLSVTRFAFSTAPTVNSFTVTPSTGCAPQAVALSWSTTGAARVTISGISGDLPANGSTSVTLLTTTDLVLTAYAPSGETTNVPRHVTLLPATLPPTPSPSGGSVSFGGTITGLLPVPGTAVTKQFVQHESNGSTFTITGSVFTYVAGTSAGTDIVRLTVEGPCGPASADFTVTVVEPGSPQINSFFADPAVGCAPANIVLYWVTTDVRVVTITGIDFPLTATGATGVTLSATTTFTLTAFGVGGQKVTKTITVPVDSGIQTPVLSQNDIHVLPGTETVIEVSGVADPTLLNYRSISRLSGGYIVFTSVGHFTYFAGGTFNNQDVFWITYRNGCGQTYTEFRANVVAP